MAEIIRRCWYHNIFIKRDRVSSKVNSLQLNFVIGTAAELIKLYPVIHWP